MLGVIVGALVLAGCGGVPTAPPGTQLPDDVSQAHREAVADGEVTEEEYTAGYRRYVACVSEAGYEITELGRPSTVYDFLVPSEAVESGADDQCYRREFIFIDAAWQTQNPPTTSATPLLQECLEEAGLPTDGNEEELKQRMIDHGLDVFGCLGLDAPGG